MGTYRLVFIGSTGGGVLSKVAKLPFVQEMTLEAVSDRECGFLEVATSLGIASVQLSCSSGAAFSQALCDRYGDRDDLIFISFYTKLFQDPFLSQNKGRIFNCHPSILPSFKGMNGFEDTMKSSSRFMGCSLHIVDEGMDTGTIVIQSALPIDKSLDVAHNRHKVFLSQYYSTVQFLKWIHDGRFVPTSSDSFQLSSVKFSPSPFSPNLDPDFFELIGEENGLLG